MAPRREPESLAVALAAMARDLLAQETVQETLDRIVDHSVDLVDGCEAAGIMVVRDKEVRTLSVSDELVTISDRMQGEFKEGPCYDAARRLQQVYRIPDMTETAERWPLYTPKARDLGIGSMMGFLLFTDDENLGALDLYSSQPGAFTEAAEQVGWLLASHAAVAFASARNDAQLREAISTRQDIGEALGIVMERYKVPEQQAFAVLKKASQDRNLKLRELARQVVETGEIPGAR
jgi:transcriptional regulator with GAF, ATPase, and Fis domain